MAMAESPKLAAMAGADGRRRPRVGAMLAEAARADRDRWTLWLPVGLGVGVALYFVLPVEPPIWWGAVVAVFAVVLAWFSRERPVLVWVAITVGVIGMGFAAGAVRTVTVGGHVLDRRLPPSTLEGRVVGVEPVSGGARITLDRIVHRELVPPDVPSRVRVRLAAKHAPPPIGSRIRMRAELRPPPGPVAPGGFDFQRHLYFLGIGASGFAIGGYATVAPPEPTTLMRLESLRLAIYHRFVEGRPGQAGGVGAALATGKRGAIPGDVLQAMRDSGLAHMLAISGLHMGLVAGILFFAVRGVLATIEPLARRFAIKKWAAAAALIGGFGYLLISGATVPTQRAFLMTGLVLLAVLLDRNAISMRLVAWAAAIILLTAPEAMLGPSFQMSFAAVVALVATYEHVRRPIASFRHGDGGRAGLWRLAAVYVIGIAVTSLVAGAATAPYAAYHFNRLAAFGLLANLLAMPVMALWIMPWTLLAMAAMPFGLEAVPLAAMGWGIDAVIDVARFVAGLPNAVVLVPAMPEYGIALVTVGGLWLCLWRQRWRFLGLPLIVGGLATVALYQPPDVLVDGRAKLMAVRAADGGLMLSSGRTARFTASGWLRRDALDEADVWPSSGASADGTLTCDRLGCIYRTAGETVALVRDERALPEDCRAAGIVVALVPVRRSCPSAHTVIDRFDLWRNGSHAVWLGEGSVRVADALAGRGKRPWVVRRFRQRDKTGDP